MRPNYDELSATITTMDALLSKQEGINNANYAIITALQSELAIVKKEKDSIAKELANAITHLTLMEQELSSTKARYHHTLLMIDACEEDLDSYMRSH